MGPLGFEPRTASAPGFEEVDWDGFRRWLLSRLLSRKNARQMYTYARKFHGLLLSRDAGAVMAGFSKWKRKLILEALANLCKFLGCYSYFKTWRLEHGFKWEREESLRTLIDTLDRGREDVEEWLLSLRELGWTYYFPGVYMLLTGLRPGEACTSLSIIAEQGLDGYWNPELGILEHFRFEKLFLRRCKNAFISFLSPRLLSHVEKFQTRITLNALRLRLRKAGYPIRFNQLRKRYATILREAGIPGEAVDLLQGRVSKSLFARFYYKPLLDSLKTRVLQTLHPLEVRLLG